MISQAQLFAIPLRLLAVYCSAYVFNSFLSILTQLRLSFKDFDLSEPRTLQYLSVNLTIFTYCSESLRKRFSTTTKIEKTKNRNIEKSKHRKIEKSKNQKFEKSKNREIEKSKNRKIKNRIYYIIL